MRRRGMIAAVLLSLSGCAGTTTRTEVGSTTDVRVEVRGGGELDGWEPDDPRLLRAVAQTRAIVGHPVQFQFRFDTMPRPRGPFFDALFERHVGRVPHQLEWTRREEPDAFEWARGLIRVVLFDYEGSEWRPEIELKEDPGLLRIRMGGGALLPDGAILHAIREAWERDLVRRYAGREVDEIPQAELVQYGRYLVSWIAERAESQGRAAADAGPARAKSVIILRVLGLTVRLGQNHPLQARLTTWLVEAVGTFRDVHSHEAEALARAPANAPIRRAEEAWGTWLRTGALRLPDDALYDLVDAIVLRPPGDRDLVEIGGVDPLRLWLVVVDRWIAAGAPRAGDESAVEPRARALFDRVVCARGHSRTGGTTSSGACREQTLWRWAVSRPARRERVVHEVAARDHPGLALAAAENLLYAGAPRDLLALWLGLGGADRSWRAVTMDLPRLMHPIEAGPDRDAIVAVTIDLWRSSPRKRPQLLFLLAVIDSLYDRLHGAVDWPQFGRTFGAPIGRDELGAFLDEGPEALRAAWCTWPALSRGWSRAEVVLPRFERFGVEGLGMMIQQMRAEGGAADLARVQAWLVQRVRNDPSEDRRWRHVIDDLGGR